MLFLFLFQGCTEGLPSPNRDQQEDLPYRGWIPHAGRQAGQEQRRHRVSILCIASDPACIQVSDPHLLFCGYRVNHVPTFLSFLHPVSGRGGGGFKIKIPQNARKQQFYDTSTSSIKLFCNLPVPLFCGILL